MHPRTRKEILKCLIEKSNSLHLEEKRLYEEGLLIGAGNMYFMQKGLQIAIDMMQKR